MRITGSFGPNCFCLRGSIMTGARATKPLSVDTPIVSAGASDASVDHEPSMNEILASIRQIISDQNEEADRAAVKAVDEVANPLPTQNNIDSIIGSVAADHWSDAEEIPQAGDVAHSLTQTEIDRLAVDKEKMAARVKSVTAARPTKKPRPAPISLEDLVEQEALIEALAVAPKAAPLAPPIVRPRSAQQQAMPVRQARHADEVVLNAGDRYREKPNSIDANIPVDQMQQNPATGSALERLVARRSATSVEAAAPIIRKPVAAPAALPPAAAIAAASPVSPVAVKPDDMATKLRNEQIIKAASSLSDQIAVASPPVTPPALLSKGANKSINASFERLAVSMLEDRKEEMDQMLVDVMRPMLQEWLEDNLPSLVERLVREEIERVSRGTH